MSKNNMAALLTTKWEQLKFQRELQDKWFKFYLTVLGVSITATIALTKSGFLEYNHESGSAIVGSVFLLASALGLIFYRMSIEQRKLNIEFVGELKNIEAELKDKPKVLFRGGNRGSAYFQSLLYVLTITISFSIGATLISYFIVTKIDLIIHDLSLELLFWILIFPILFIAYFIILHNQRQTLLSECEKPKDHDKDAKKVVDILFDWNSEQADISEAFWRDFWKQLNTLGHDDKITLKERLASPTGQDK